MAIVFSKITITTEKGKQEFLVGGSPRTGKDLKGWVAYENFINFHCGFAEANVEVYSYGNAQPYKATPEEVAYMMKRIEKQPDFLAKRCSKGITRTIYLQGGIAMNKMEELYQLSKKVKAAFPSGTRLLLIHMNDPYSPVEDNTRGTVDHVDDQAQIHMKWDNGRTLAINVEEDLFRQLTEEELAEEEGNKQTVDFGDDCQIVIPDRPVDCSKLGYFDELEYECWELVKRYCEKFGVEILPNEDGEETISFDIAKGIQDKIIEELQQAGVQFQFEEQSEELTDTDEPLEETSDFEQKM